MKNTNGSPKISIVVPIYCVEKYLKECIDSLLAQVLRQIEIILVDDGSPDDCGNIADNYARQDERIKVVHQVNAGLGPARNAGMKVATGDYIGFVDSDDWIRPEMYKNLYETAVRENADIVVSGHCDVTNGIVVQTKRHPLAGETLRTSDDIMEVRKNLYGHKMYDNVVESFPMSVCMSIYRKKLLEKNNLFFQEILSEDIIFNLSAYQHAKIIAFTDGVDYCYRKEQQQSITQSFSEKKLLRYQEFLTVLTSKANRELDEECLMRVKRTAIDYCRLYVRSLGNLAVSFKQKKEYIRDFAQKQEIKCCWEGYPIETLPIQQRLFHMMIVKEYYGMALLMNYIRRKFGKGK